MKAKSSLANPRLVVMLTSNLILFFVVEKQVFWRSVEREIYLTNLAAMISVIPLVLCVPVVVGGKVWHRWAALMLAVYPVIIFFATVSDMLKYLSNQ